MSRAASASATANSFHLLQVRFVAHDIVGGNESPRSEEVAIEASRWTKKIGGNTDQKSFQIDEGSADPDPSQNGMPLWLMKSIVDTLFAIRKLHAKPKHLCACRHLGMEVIGRFLCSM